MPPYPVNMGDDCFVRQLRRTWLYPRVTTATPDGL